MQKDIQLDIYPFGMFRTIIHSPPFKLQIPFKSGLKDLRIYLEKALHIPDTQENVKELLDLCAFSDETKILEEDFVFKEDSLVHLLPPVCGG